MYFSHSQRVLLLCLIYESVFVHIVFPYLTSIQADPKLKKKFGLTRRACSEACRTQTEFECKYYKYVDNNGICLISGDDMEVIKKYTSKSIERALFKEISNLKESIDKLYDKYSYMDELSETVEELKLRANKEAKTLQVEGKQFKETVMRQELSVAALDRKVKELEFKENQGKTDFIAVKAQIHQFLRQLAGMKNLFDIISLEVKDSSSELTSLSLQVKSLKKATDNLRTLLLNRKDECNSCNNDAHEQNTKPDDNLETPWTPTDTAPEVHDLITTVDGLKEELEQVKIDISELFTNVSKIMRPGKNNFRSQNKSRVPDVHLRLKTLENRLNYSRQDYNDMKGRQQDIGNILSQQNINLRSCSDKVTSLSEVYKDSAAKIVDLRMTLKSFKKELDALKDLNTHSKMKSLETEQEKIKLRLKSVEDSRNSHENQIVRLKDKVAEIKSIRLNCSSCNQEERFKSEIKRAQNLFKSKSNILGVPTNAPSTSKPTTSYNTNNQTSSSFIEMQAKRKAGKSPHTIIRMNMKLSQPEPERKKQATQYEVTTPTSYHAFLKPSLSSTAQSNVKPVKFCPENWFKSVRRCLHYMPRRVTWRGAKSDCQNIDARVASLLSLEQWTDMKIFLAIYSDLNIPLWLSKDSISSMNLKEFKDHMIMPFNWKNLSRKYEENCLVMDPSNNFTLSLIFCKTKNHYATICELSLSTHENEAPVNITIHITKTAYDSRGTDMSENTLPSHWDNTSDHSQLCPAFAKEIGGYCFKYIPVKQSNKRAIETCKRLGATLATVQDIQKELMLENFLVTIGTPNTVWLSPTFLDNDGKWKWASTKEPVIYTNYFPGRPDTLRKTRCNQIKKAWGFKWLDKYCWNSKKSVEHSFICEFKSSRSN